MRILKDYQYLAYESGDGAVMSVTVDLDVGEFITFRYGKDGSVDGYSDCAVVHSIAIVTEAQSDSPEAEPVVE